MNALPLINSGEYLGGMGAVAPMVTGCHVNHYLNRVVNINPAWVVAARPDKRFYLAFN